MKLFIDNKEVDIDQLTTVSISLSIASVTQIETGRTGYSKTIRVPMTARNREIMGDADEVSAVALFNQTTHTARIETDGATVITGVPMLAKCETITNGTGWYNINIIGTGKEWVQLAAKNMFNTSGINFNAKLDADVVANSWSNSSPVKFLPVQHDSFTASSDILQGCVRMLTFDDYFPFINVVALMEAIAMQAGYTITSDFLDSEYGRSLYISGRYPEKDVAIYNERMGFQAKRFEAVTATADRFGRVYADPFTPLSSVGNLVDTADHFESKNGVTIADVYNRNNAFQKIDGQIAFVPPESVNVGFEYNIRYRTDYIIGDRTQLRCFNRLYLDDNIERIYKVVNKFPDRRSEYKAGWSYRLIIFGYQAGQNFKFTHDISQGVHTTVTVKTFATRSTTIESTLGNILTNPQLWIEVTAGQYTLYSGDWALYDGYIAESGQIDIELTARSAARRIMPSQPALFDLIHFGGADQGMNMTLTNEITLRPIFSAHPCEGMNVQYKDIAAHQIHQIDFINSIKQLFNLYFYTDSQSKIIYIEPRSSFYRDDVIVDWSDMIDLNKPIAIEELGADMARGFGLSYREGDGSVARWDETNAEMYGFWSSIILNKFASEGRKIYYNPIFTATINKNNQYPDAADATFIQVGNRTRSGLTPSVQNLNFEPKIVRYLGLKPLSGTQWWGWPTYAKSYPKVAFHDPEGSSPFTLCFEDRDGVKGLHSHYDKNIALYNSGRRITLYINLKADQIEPFIIPNSLKRDFRALFKLRIGGEDVMCRLEEISDYNPSKRGSTKCIFIKNV